MSNSLGPIKVSYELGNYTAMKNDRGRSACSDMEGSPRSIHWGNEGTEHYVSPYKVYLVYKKGWGVHNHVSM